MDGSARRLLPVERRRKTAELAEEAGALRIGELATRFEVSEETVRRDLILLERQGLLTRAHGGALAVEVGRESPYLRREISEPEAKRRIAEIAAELISDAATVILDSGTTTHQMLPFLRTKRDLVIITNGTNHVAELLANPTTTVVLAGGVVRPNSMGTAGDLAVATLEKLRADHTFLATHGFSAEHGITYPNLEEAAVKRAMIAAAREVTLLADGTKYGRTAMVQVAPLDALDRIVTSGPIPEEDLAEMEELGVEVCVIDSPPGEGRSPVRGARQEGSDR